MRILILTLPLYVNYGGILQCYALQTVLERMGHDVQVLSKPQYGRFYYMIYPLAVCKRLLKRFLLGKDVAIFKAPHQIVRQQTDRFIHKYIHQYKKRVWTAKIASHFDAFVVGSDQVWRPAYSQPIEEAFLSFLGDSDIKRIAYAASFGVDNCDEYTPKQLKICSQLLQKFNAVSVRETSGVLLCRKYFGVDAVQMLDPTLLLDADDYRVLIRNGKTKPSTGEMLVYILDKSEGKIALVNRIAKEKGLTPFWLDSPDEQMENFPFEKRIKMSVEQWLRSFDDAEFVFTDSFHGCIFSIIFRKQFLAIGNKERGISRFYSLLGVFSLMDRLICCEDNDYNLREKINSKIDYKGLFENIETHRLCSFDFIKKNCFHSNEAYYIYNNTNV